MKKLIYLAIILISCTKQPIADVLDAHHPPVPPELILSISERTEPYNTTLTNECYPETVALVGVAHYKLTEYQDGRTRVSIYEITVDSVFGRGDVSQLLYIGGGKIRGVNKTDTVSRSQAAYGKQDYDLEYHTAKGPYSIKIFQDAEYQSDSAGVVLIDRNIYSESCKP